MVTRLRVKYSDDEERDDHGRWTSGGSSDAEKTTPDNYRDTWKPTMTPEEGHAWVKAAGSQYTATVVHMTSYGSVNGIQGQGFNVSQGNVAHEAGMYFATDRPTAAFYEYKGDKALSAVVVLQNPVEVSFDSTKGGGPADFLAQTYEAAGVPVPDNPNELTPGNATDDLKAAGFDGVIITVDATPTYSQSEESYRAAAIGGDQVVVFDKEQATVIGTETLPSYGSGGVDGGMNPEWDAYYASLDTDNPLPDPQEAAIDRAFAKRYRGSRPASKEKGVSAAYASRRKYSDDEERDDRGRWTSGGDSASSDQKPFEMARGAAIGDSKPPVWEAKLEEVGYSGEKYPHGEGQLRAYGSMEAKEYFPNTDTKPGTDIRALEAGGRTIMPSPGFVEAYDQKFLGPLQVYAQDNGTTQKELLDRMTQNAQDYMREHSPCIAVPVSALEKVLDDGRFKNQFEAKTSGGAYKPGLRKDAESELFGYPKTEVSGADRPVYGYVGDKMGSDGYVDQYGGTRIVLNDDVKERTTVTQNDSLDRGAVPEPMNDVSWRQDMPAGDSGLYTMGLSTISGRDLSDADITNAAQAPELGTVPWENVDPHDASGSYIEAQFHGGLSVSDIAEVILPRQGYSGASFDEITARLDSLGIVWSAP